MGFDFCESAVQAEAPSAVAVRSTQDDDGQAQQVQQDVVDGQKLLIENLLLRVDRVAEAAAEEAQANDALDDVDSANNSPSVRVWERILKFTLNFECFICYLPDSIAF